MSGMALDDGNGKLTRLEASEAVTGLGWRYVLGEFRTEVRTGSLSLAADVAGRAAAVPEAQGHLRMDVREDRVLVADFKSNRPAPTRIEDADPVYVRQMAIYAAVLADVFPQHAIEAALVWTDGPRLMALPEKLMAQALAELGRGG